MVCAWDRKVKGRKLNCHRVAAKSNAWDGCDGTQVSYPRVLRRIHRVFRVVPCLKDSNVRMLLVERDPSLGT